MVLHKIAADTSRSLQARILVPDRKSPKTDLTLGPASKHGNNTKLQSPGTNTQTPVS